MGDGGSPTLGRDEPRIGHRRTAVIVVATLAAAALCVRLGFWQLDRLEHRRIGNAQIRAGLLAPPRELTEAPTTAGFRRARATGTYDADRSFVLYGRPLRGAPGNHVLTPLLLTGGAAVLVDRGWIPSGGQTEGIALPATPTGPVTVEGILVPGETGGTLDGSTVDRVDLEVIAGRVPYRLGSAYLLLRSQAPTTGAPTPVPPPELTDGPHLSYAIQWFSFAAIALGGGVVLIRRRGSGPPRAR